MRLGGNGVLNGIFKIFPAVIKGRPNVDFRYGSDMDNLQ